VDVHGRYGECRVVWLCRLGAELLQQTMEIAAAIPVDLQAQLRLADSDIDRSPGAIHNAAPRHVDSPLFESRH